jgi:hypothetical protein
MRQVQEECIMLVKYDKIYVQPMYASVHGFFSGGTQQRSIVETFILKKMGEQLS